LQSRLEKQHFKIRNFTFKSNQINYYGGLSPVVAIPPRKAGISRIKYQEYLYEEIKDYGIWEGYDNIIEKEKFIKKLVAIPPRKAGISSF